MNQKTMISTMLMAALTFAIVGVGIGIQKAAAYTSEELTSATAGAYNVAKNARISSFAIETCTNQITMQDYSHVDECISIIKTFDRHMSMAVSEANSDIQSVTGYGTTTTTTGLN